MFDLSGLHVSFIFFCIPSVAFKLAYQFLQFFHSSALISFFSTKNGGFFSSLAKQVFASACHFAFASILHVVRCAASAIIFFSVLLVAAAAVFTFFIVSSQTQWHVSIDVVVSESPSSFSFQVFVFLGVSSLLSFWCLMHAGKSPSTFLNLSLPPPSLVYLSLL